MTTLYGALIVWLLGLILVESFLFEPLRDWLFYAVRPRPHMRGTPRTGILWRKASYLSCCHLCTSVWLGQGVALLLPGPLKFPLQGLLVSAVAHCILEIFALLRRTNT